MQFLKDGVQTVNGWFSHATAHIVVPKQSVQPLLFLLESLQTFYPIFSEYMSVYLKLKLLLWWFFLFYVLVLKIFCAVGALCMFSYF